MSEPFPASLAIAILSVPAVVSIGLTFLATSIFSKWIADTHAVVAVPWLTLLCSWSLGIGLREPAWELILPSAIGLAVVEVWDAWVISLYGVQLAIVSAVAYWRVQRIHAKTNRDHTPPTIRRTLTIPVGLLLVSWLSSLSFACEMNVNGICYDKPNAKNPGLTVSWEMLDLETGKPIPDVWISFYWREFKDRNSSTCARNVIGRTDANGRFSNTAKDGSWMAGGVEYSKPGYYPVRYELYANRTYITDEHPTLFESKDDYPAWEDRLKAMGYTIDPKYDNKTYTKQFELGDEYKRIFDQFWQPRGHRRYWLKHRGFPNRFQAIFAGVNTCVVRAGQVATIESVGLDDPKNQDAYMRMWQGWEAYQLFCDAIWDSLPMQSPDRSEAGFALNALALTGPMNAATWKTYATYFDAKTLEPNSGVRIQPEQRRNFCKAMKPYLERLERGTNP